MDFDTFTKPQILIVFGCVLLLIVWYNRLRILGYANELIGSKEAGADNTDSTKTPLNTAKKEENSIIIPPTIKHVPNSKGTFTLIYHTDCGWSTQFITETWNKLLLLYGGADEKYKDYGFSVLDVKNIANPASNPVMKLAIGLAKNEGMGFPSIVYEPHNTGNPDMTAGFQDVEKFKNWVDSQLTKVEDENDEEKVKEVKEKVEGPTPQ